MEVPWRCHGCTMGVHGKYYGDTVEVREGIQCMLNQDSHEGFINILPGFP